MTGRPTSASRWLWLDERGTWERTATELLAKTAERASVLALSETEVDVAIADELRLMALSALWQDGPALGEDVLP